LQIFYFISSVKELIKDFAKVDSLPFNNSSRHVYNYCTSRAASRPAQKKRASLAARANQLLANTGRGAEFVGHELYRRLKEYLQEYLVQLQKVRTSSIELDKGFLRFVEIRDS
jgi:cullin 1